jgi:hypothetical protein
LCRDEAGVETLGDRLPRMKPGFGRDHDVDIQLPPELDHLVSRLPGAADSARAA